MRGSQSCHALRIASAAFVSFICGAVTQAAVPWSVEQGATRVLLVAADGGTQTELVRLAEVLQRSYGATPDTTRLLFADAARTEAIESALLDMSARTSPRDTLVVVLGLALHNKGRDRVLVTYDFDPERPWTGMSLNLLEKLASGGVAGTYWQFAPDCGPPAKAAYQQYEQRSNAYLGDSGGGVALVTFCESGGAGPGRELARALTTTLREAAADRAGREGSSGAVVIMEEVLGRLTKAARDMEIRTGFAPARGATLRVRPATSEPVAGELYAALVAAPSDVDAVAVLDRAVEQGRSAKDPAKVADVANALADYSIKTTADTNRRARAVQALGSLPAEAARPALERVFALATDGRLRATALREWQRVAKPGDISLISAGLGDAEPAVQIAALLAAASAADKSATDAVIGALRTADDAQVRMAAARALIAVAEPTVAEAVLIGALRDNVATVRAEAANSLGQIALSAAAAQPLLAAANTDPAALVRESAVYALSAAWPRLGAEEHANIARQLLDIAVSRNQAEGVRIAAVYTIARGGRSVPGGDRILGIVRREDEPAALRKTAIEAIGQLGLTEAVPALASVARNKKEKTELRVAAAAALGNLPDSRAADALWELAASDSVDVAVVARRALDQGKVFSPAAAAAIRDVKLPIERRAAAARLLGNRQDPRAFDLLVAALADPSGELREAAIASLSRFTDPPYLERMAGVLASSSNPGRETHEGVAFALAAMNTDAARKILEAHAGASDNDVRHAVAVGLGAAKSTREGYQALAKLSRDESGRVRAATAVSLGRIENFNVAELLEPMTRDEDSDVRAAAVESLRTALARGKSSQRR